MKVLRKGKHYQKKFGDPLMLFHRIKKNIVRWDGRCGYSNLKVGKYVLRIKGGKEERIKGKMERRDFSSFYETGMPGMYAKKYALLYFKIGQIMAEKVPNKIINIPLAIIEFPEYKGYKKLGKIHLPFLESQCAIIELSLKDSKRVYDFLKESLKKGEKKAVERRLQKTMEKLKTNLWEIWEKTKFLPKEGEFWYHDFDLEGRVADYDAFIKVRSRKKAEKLINSLIERLWGDIKRVLEGGFIF